MTTIKPENSPDTHALPPGVQARLQQAGIRRTLATRALLGLFLARPEVLFGHTQAMNGLIGRGVVADRVTVYRLLDRLAACGVLRRQSDAQARSWRYSLAPTDGADAVARYECLDCRQQFALPQALSEVAPWAEVARRRALAEGHHVAQWELCLRGRCALCNERADGGGAMQRGGGGAASA